MIAVDVPVLARTHCVGRSAALPQLECIAGFDGYFKSLSTSWETALDYSLGELRGCRFYEFIHADDVAETMAVVRRVALGASGGALQNRFRRRDGTFRTLLWREEPVVNDRRFFAVAFDVTDTEARLMRRYFRR